MGAKILLGLIQLQIFSRSEISIKTFFLLQVIIIDGLSLEVKRSEYYSIVFKTNLAKENKEKKKRLIRKAIEVTEFKVKNKVCFRDFYFFLCTRRLNVDTPQKEHSVVKRSRGPVARDSLVTLCTSLAGSCYWSSSHPLQ